jgi:hypothetical protein
MAITAPMRMMVAQKSFRAPRLVGTCTAAKTTNITARKIRVSRCFRKFMLGPDYAFSRSGSPKIPVGRINRTTIRMVKAIASRIGVEM